MAAVVDGSQTSNAVGSSTLVDDSGDKNLWTKILSQVQSSSVNKLPPNKNILILGEPESGKTTLIAKLQGNEDPKKGTGLEYFYLNVRDEYRDDHTRLGVWILDGDAYHKNLLKFALSEKTFPHSLVVLVASMNQPWKILESLDNWASVLQQHINRLKLSQEDIREYQQHRVKTFQSYTDPGEDSDAGGISPHKRTSASFPHAAGVTTNGASPGDTDDSLLLPLGETTLTNNLGIDIVVVITKSDSMSTLKQEMDYKDEHFDFIQQRVRKFCLSYGAALFYTSVKEDKNCDLLYRYLVHRIYNLPFSSPALVVEEDAVFIPSGWDNEKKISILYENMTLMKPDDSYSDIITRPIVRKQVQREAEVQAENDQMFLIRQQALYNQQAPTPKKQDPIMRSPAGVQKTADRRMNSPGQAGISSQKTHDGAKNLVTNEGVLANFFNSLLNKKTGAGHAAGGMKSAEKAVRNDAAAELDRMTSPKKVISSTSHPEKSHHETP